MLKKAKQVMHKQYKDTNKNFIDNAEMSDGEDTGTGRNQVKYVNRKTSSGALEAGINRRVSMMFN